MVALGRAWLSRLLVGSHIASSWLMPSSQLSRLRRLPEPNEVTARVHTYLTGAAYPIQLLHNSETGPTLVLTPPLFPKEYERRRG